MTTNTVIEVSNPNPYFAGEVLRFNAGKIAELFYAGHAATSLVSLLNEQLGRLDPISDEYLGVQRLEKALEDIIA